MGARAVSLAVDSIFGNLNVFTMSGYRWRLASAMSDARCDDFGGSSKVIVWWKKGREGTVENFQR